MISRKKGIRIIWILWIVVLLFDQITKYIIRKSISLGNSVPIIKDIFYITHVNNTGAAFGIFPNAQKFFIVVSIISIGLFLYLGYIYKERNPSVYISIGLILGGATGNNIFDRLIFGKVTDFLDFGINPKIRWPAFNIADSCVVIGSFLIALAIMKGDLFYFKKEKDVKNESN